MPKPKTEQVWASWINCLTYASLRATLVATTTEFGSMVNRGSGALVVMVVEMREMRGTGVRDGCLYGDARTNASY